jgi:hypothetical protein
MSISSRRKKLVEDIINQCAQLYERDAHFLYFSKKHVQKLTLKKLYSEYITQSNAISNIEESMLTYIIVNAIEKPMNKYDSYVNKCLSFSILIYYLAILENVFVGNHALCKYATSKPRIQPIPKEILQKTELQTQNELRIASSNIENKKCGQHCWINVYWYLKRLIRFYMTSKELQSIIDICHVYISMVYHELCDTKKMKTLSMKTRRSIK